MSKGAHSATIAHPIFKETSVDYKNAVLLG